MKLAHYQIEHIREWINIQNIWYDEIKDELLDHMVCAVEERITRTDISFVNALAEICLEVDPSAIQRQKLKVEHIRAFKEVLLELKEFSPLKLLSFSILIAILTYLQLTPSPDSASYLESVMLCSAVSIFIFAGVYTYRFRQRRPFSNVYIFSRMNGIYFPSILYATIPLTFLENWLISHPVQNFIYVGLQFWFMICGIKVLYKSFNHLKHATH